MFKKGVKRMKCLKDCIFMSYVKPFDRFVCLISKEPVTFGETCLYENKTVTELNMEANYKELKK